jgi:hypothetical protein
MGHNTTIMIMNDAMHEIDKDPAGWWRKTKNAMAECYCSANPVEYGHGSHVNGFSVVSNKHADFTSVVVVGRNSAEVVGTSLYSAGNDEGLVNVLNDILAAKGLRVAKIQNRKKKKV